MKKRRRYIFIKLLILILIAFSIYKVKDKVFDFVPDVFVRKSNYISANNYMVVDLNTGQIIIKKGDEDRIRPASLAKLYSLYMTANLFNSDTIIDIRKEALGMIKENSSMSNILPGRYYANNIYHAILAPSGNDAMYALADYVGGNFDPSLTNAKDRVLEFTRILNKYLKNHGFNSTYIEDVTGYCENTYTNLKDLNKVAQSLIKIKWFMNIVSHSEYTTNTPSGKSLTWLNTNKFLDENSKFFNPNIQGVKTGSLDSHKNLISLYKNDKSRYLIFVIGSKSDDFRYTDTLNLIDKIETGK